MPNSRFKMRVSVHLFFIKDNQILLSLRKNITSAGLYGVVAGHLNGNETVTQAIIREAKEEADVDLKPNDFKITTVCHSYIKDKNIEYIQFYAICRQWLGEIKNNEPDKCGELKFYPLDNLPENLVPYVRDGINKTMSGANYYEYGW